MAADQEYLGAGQDSGTVLGRSSTDKIGFFMATSDTPVSKRAGLAAQATSLVGTASSADFDTLTKAALIEVMNTLTYYNLWKGAA